MKKAQLVRILVGCLFLAFFFHVVTVVVNINHYTIVRIMYDAQMTGSSSFVDIYDLLNIYNLVFCYTLYLFIVFGVFSWFMLPSKLIRFKPKGIDVLVSEDKDVSVNGDVRVVDPAVPYVRIEDNDTCYDDIVRKIDELERD